MLGRTYSCNFNFAARNGVLLKINDHIFAPSQAYFLEDHPEKINGGILRGAIQHDAPQLPPFGLVNKIFQNKSGVITDIYNKQYVHVLIWLFLIERYGLPFVSPNNILVSTINGVGAAIETAYVVIFLCFASSKKERLRTLGLASAVAAVFAVVALVSMLALHGEARKLLCGLAMTFFSICMYASPLSIMRLVIKTKSVEFMPFLLSLAVFLCGTSWFVYGLLGRDPFVAVSDLHTHLNISFIISTPT